MNDSKAPLAIDTLLFDIEREESISVLYACESGSRAWGFESRDSDWDVRFIFVRQSDAYLSIDEPPDQIERQIKSEALDVVGWDIRKALRLLRKSNPSLIEWLHSPIIYRANQPFTKNIQQLSEYAFRPVAAAYHYTSMARSNEHGLLDEDGSDVVLKRYFYVLRAVLAFRWIVEHRTVPPVAFRELAKAFIAPASPSMTEVAELLDRKRSGSELGLGPRLPNLHEFLTAELSRMSSELSAVQRTASPVPPRDPVFDEFFRSIVGQ